jgi:acyl-CoA reductase-like NAD-dependent aldehyde dehydrogenase
MQHEKFAKRVAERLEAEAERLEENSQWMKRDVTAARANELRVAAHMVRDMARAVRRAKNEPPPAGGGPMMVANPPLQAQA